MQPIPNTFAVNIGDMLEQFSNSAFRATPHRVVNYHVSKARISIPFFFEPSLESKINDNIEYGSHIYNAYTRSYPNVKLKN